MQKPSNYIHIYIYEKIHMKNMYQAYRYKNMHLEYAYKTKLNYVSSTNKKCISN